MVLASLLFIIVIGLLSVMGARRVLKQDDLISELHELRQFKAVSRALITDFNLEALVEDSTHYGLFLREQYSETDSLIPFSPPVDGYVTQALDMDNGDIHPGVDIAAKAGDLIRAPADGLVVFSDRHPELGNMIILAHEKGFYTVFGHNDTNLVQQRQWVSHLQPIGRVGGTGNTEGPHLHFEIWNHDRIIDPRNFIEEYNRKDVSLK